VREEKVARLLRQAGREAIVTVTAKMNLDHTEVLKEEMSEGTVLSSAETLSTLQTSEGLPEGPEGVRANLPEGQFGQLETTTTEETEDIVTNYAPSRTVTKQMTEPGGVEVDKVSVVVDGNYETELDDNGEPTGQQQYVPLTDTERDSLQQLVANAAGTDVEDVMLMDQPLQLAQLGEAQRVLEQAAAGSWQHALREYGWPAIQLILVIAGLLVVRRFLLRALAPPDVLEEEVIEEPPAEPGPEEQRRRRIAEEVEGMSQKEPEAVASLLRAWMSDHEE
jgi:flagellar M-ring protein FliF